MDSANVFDFAQRARAGNRIKNKTFPREAAEDEFQAAELQEPPRRQGADNVTSAADTDHQRAG
jgi:hypothetical protein